MTALEKLVITDQSNVLFSQEPDGSIHLFVQGAWTQQPGASLNTGMVFNGKTIPEALKAAMAARKKLIRRG